MNYQNVYLDDTAFLWSENLKSDGSNFVEWYLRLRDMLWVNDVLYVIQKQLGDKPENSASESDKLAYQICRDLFICVECTMHCTMAPELQVRF